MSALHQAPVAAALLAPISQAHPAGQALRHDPVYRAIIEARRHDDPNLPQGIWEQPHKKSDWGQVEQLCVEALTHRSKDLQIAAWLGEAWIHRRGLAGLAAAAELLAGLLAHYWDDLHPRMEDGDIGYRAAPLAWFDKHGGHALQAVALAAGVSAAGRAFTLAEWEVVLRQERLGAEQAGARRGSAEPDPKTSGRAQFSQAAAHSPAGFYVALRASLAQSQDALALLAQTQQQYLGEVAPRLAGLEGGLQRYAQALQELVGAPAPHIEPEAPAEQTMETIPSIEPPRATGAPRNRVEAYRRLGEVADYLMLTEPHSPVPYLVKRAIAWGEMPLAELLQELLDSESDLKQIYRLLGTRG